MLGAEKPNGYAAAGVSLIMVGISGVAAIFYELFVDPN